MPGDGRYEWDGFTRAPGLPAARRTFRMVVDVGNWDATRAMNAPGQSGGPRSAHYGDLFPAWVAGDSFPLLYTRAAVEAHAEARISLRAVSRR